MTALLKPASFLVLGMLAASSSATAQRVQAAGWERVTGLEQGTEIRVELAGGRTLRGFLQSATAESLAINAERSQETLRREEVRRVQVKRPGHRGRNALIGLGVGTAGGLAVGAAIDHATGNGWWPLGRATFTPMGAVIGTVVGVALPTGGWREIYRAP